jgi:hypothetical protein
MYTFPVKGSTGHKAQLLTLIIPATQERDLENCNSRPAQAKASKNLSKPGVAVNACGLSYTGG